MEFIETTHGEQLLGNNSNNIVFIDPTISSYQSFLTQLQTSQTILLDPTRDGIQQITEILAQQINVSSVQIISHGTSANLFLGNAQFNLNTIDRYADNLQSWTNALTTDADILFYGCNLGAGEAGQAFVQTLSRLTGADIAASNDLTGSATLGGDWELEVTTGQIESIPGFQPNVIENYSAVFDPTIDFRDFANISNLQLNGNATQTEGVLRLTPSRKNQRGSAFYTTPFFLNLETSFQTHFQFRLSGGSGSAGREGLTFMLQNYKAGAQSLGSKGQGLGYGAINKSIAIEFDTGQNSFDPNDNHVSILSHGSISSPRAVATPSFDLNSGNPLNAWINYNGSTNLLEVFLAEDTTKPTTALLSHTIDLVPILGSNFWTGFSGATAIETTFNNQDIENWNFSATTLDVTPPTAELNAANIIVNNSKTYTFSVTYSDDNAVNVASLNNSDVRVTGPNGFNRLATLIGVDNNINGSPRTATYRINAPGGTWNATDAGTYSIALQANQVSDVSGNFMTARALGTFKAIETTLPTASLNTLNPVVEGDTSYNFTVTYSDNTEIASTTFDGQDILVTRNSGGFSQLATFISAINNGNSYTATYRITAPGETWNGADNDTYRIVLQANQVSDIFDNYIPSASLGSFSVNLPATAGTISVSSDSFIVSEGNGTARVTFVRTDGNEGAAKVTYSTTNNTALAGEDYTGITLNTVTFADGQTSATVTVNLIDDSTAEDIEAFNVTLVMVDNANLGNKRTALVTLVDNDALPTLSFYQSPITVNEADGSAVLTVILNGTPSANPVTVNYTTNNGTAIAGTDYTATSGTLQFTSGQIVKTIPISIIDNISSLLEPNKSFTVALSNPIGANLTAENAGSIVVADDDNFVRENVITGLTQPTAIEWTPDGNRMYIALKGGIVRVYENGTLLQTPFIDISRQVNSAHDRGLLGLAVHPDFFNTPYIYLLYTYDPPEVYNPENVNGTYAGPDRPGNRPSRLMRVMADPSTGYRTVLPNSEVILLGKNSNWLNTSRPDLDSTADINIAPSGVAADGTNIEDYLVTDSRSHSIGTVKFGPDGNLYVSNGDGASYNFTDPRAVRVQDLTSLSGKVLRINPITGEGLADNPFYDGNSNSNRSKVYDYGFRNPFRFTFHPTNGQIYLGDVGWATWEEINASPGGQNFGWPYYEGGLNSTGNPVNTKQPGYANLPGANDFYTTVGPSVKAPTYAIKHTSGVSAIVMGDFYRGTTFPDIYQDALFFNDVQSGTIDAIVFNPTGGIASVQRFATGLAYIVEMETGPDSNLYYVNLAGGTIGRWRYTG